MKSSIVSLKFQNEFKYVRPVARKLFNSKMANVGIKISKFTESNATRAYADFIG